MTQPPQDPQDPWENPGGGNPPHNPYGGSQPPNFEKPPYGGQPYGQGQGPPPGQGPTPPPYGGDYGGDYGGGQPGGGGYGQQGGYGPGGVPPYGSGPESFGRHSGAPMLAGKGKRLVGIIIDWLIFLVLACCFAIPFGAGNKDVVETGPGNHVTYHFDRVWSGSQVIGSLLALVLAFLYFWLLTSRWNGQTLGKKAMGTRVVREDTGGAVDSKTAAVRSLVFVLLSQICCFTILVDAIWIFTNPKNQLTEDYVSGRFG
jgi:uncharacterized RDD family membrane protein YckC